MYQHPLIVLIHGGWEWVHQPSKENPMESEREQLLYGDHCIHGTAIGTPGGADFLCGLCEDGYDTWVEDPTYELTIQLDIMAYPTAITSWQASNIETKWEQLVTEFTKAGCIWVSPAALDADLVMAVRQSSSGYWDQ
jgi:hypothetical protein